MTGYEAARAAVLEGGALPVPLHLRDGHSAAGRALARVHAAAGDRQVLFLAISHHSEKNEISNSNLRAGFALRGNRSERQATASLH